MTGRAGTGVVWFRRDLRIVDHPALAEAAARHDEVATLFVLDDALLHGRAAAANRVWFMLRSVAELGEAIERLGGRLDVVAGRPADVVPAYARAIGASAVWVSRDYAPYGRRRDRAVADRLAAESVAFHRRPGVLVHEPEDVPGGGNGFGVFSPFLRAWRRVDVRPASATPDAVAAPPAPSPGPVDLVTLADAVVPEPTARIDKLPRPGERAARYRLDSWLEDGLETYETRRNELDGAGTSRLSPYIRWGLVSAAEVVRRAVEAGATGRASAASVEKFVAEVAWRDFYAHLLFREPRLLREAYRREFDDVGRRPDRDAAAARDLDGWRDGSTGIPVVDAAMRCLAATGWLSNRARLIVASFLTKDLLIDHRAGAATFLDHLVDGDVASNDGGWQWAASTGTDPQPFFRIFNPVTQGTRFDPDGSFVRAWIPELRDVPGEFVHEPWRMTAEQQSVAHCVIGRDYPAPLADHGEARARALAAFEAARRRR